jgi:hypothetical protein
LEGVGGRAMVEKYHAEAYRKESTLEDMFA